jgi:hypothetical protein
MYTVYQHWDPLRVCVVGQSYPPEFYSFIKNPRVRSVMERIAQETEEDYQKLISLLKKFQVEVLRPNINPDFDFYLRRHNNIARYDIPPMNPRDISIMLGNDFYFKTCSPIDNQNHWDRLRGEDWPTQLPKTRDDYKKLPDFVLKKLTQFGVWSDSWTSGFQKTNPQGFHEPYLSDHDTYVWSDVLSHINAQANVYNDRFETPRGFSSASSTRIGKDIYVGTLEYQQDISFALNKMRTIYPEYRWHRVDTGGHSDATFCPVIPGLIISLRDIPTYADTFPDWEVVYLPNQSWSKVDGFLKVKEKNRGKWWVPGEELNDDFTDFVEGWLGHWVGYVEETVFDVNMLVIDKHNVIVNNYNQQVFDALARHGVTPHVINFRHRYFWDGGLHCITSDVHRSGTMQDYFPNRG